MKCSIHFSNINTEYKQYRNDGKRPNIKNNQCIRSKMCWKTEQFKIIFTNYVNIENTNSAIKMIEKYA